MSFQDYKSVIDNAEPHLLLDVRPLVEVEICHLPFSLSILSVMEMRHESLSLSASFNFCCYSPDVAARHSSLMLRGEEERISQITSEENQPVETAGAR